MKNLEKKRKICLAGSETVGMLNDGSFPKGLLTEKQVRDMHGEYLPGGGLNWEDNCWF